MSSRLVRQSGGCKDRKVAVFGRLEPPLVLSDPPEHFMNHVRSTNLYSGGFMLNTQTLIARAYSAFNHRDIDSTLALMSENVSWPKASEGGRAVGKEEIRSYWTRQWKEFDPHVEPLEVIDREGGITEVKSSSGREKPWWRCSFRWRGMARLYHRERSHRSHGHKGE